MLIYWAHPIDLTEERGWTEPAFDGATVYDPASAFSQIEDPWATQRVNFGVLDGADLVVAYLPPLRTMGVPVEIEFAMQRDKALIVVVEDNDNQLRASVIVRSWQQRGARVVTLTEFRAEQVAGIGGSEPETMAEGEDT